jgi:hypothetical protein
MSERAMAGELRRACMGGEGAGVFAPPCTSGMFAHERRQASARMQTHTRPSRRGRSYLHALLAAADCRKPTLRSRSPTFVAEPTLGTAFGPALQAGSKPRRSDPQVAAPANHCWPNALPFASPSSLASLPRPARLSLRARRAGLAKARSLLVRSLVMAPNR